AGSAASGSIAAAATPSDPNAPYMYATFAETVSTKNLREYGFIGWIQSSLDNEIMKSEKRSREKFEQLFGLILDWSAFPKVVVKTVIPKAADGETPSRATKAGIVVGDQIVLLAGTRVTSVATMQGTSIEGAVLLASAGKLKKKEPYQM
ncbi:unnamed protein product, partial [Amoebophrya sp. A120]